MFKYRKSDMKTSSDDRIRMMGKVIEIIKIRRCLRIVSVVVRAEKISFLGSSDILLIKLL